MAYAIMRFCKIKAVSTFSAIERHNNNRELLKHRKNPDRSPENRSYAPKCYAKEQSLTERFKMRTEGIKIRSNAVLGYEFVLAYSPEAVGTFNHDDWVKANAYWLTRTFGAQNVISLSSHMDETTPHAHAVVVPVVDGKLRAKHYTGGRVKLSQLQDSYADAMKEFNLERGIRYIEEPDRDKPHHTSLKVFYASEREAELSETIER